MNKWLCIGDFVHLQALIQYKNIQIFFKTVCFEKMFRMHFYMNEMNYYFNNMYMLDNGYDCGIFYFRHCFFIKQGTMTMVRENGNYETQPCR